MITIFSTPRPFTGPFYQIQLNGIKSWMKLSGVKIILFDDEEQTTSKIAQDLGLTCIVDPEKNEFGTPMFKSAFERVRAMAGDDTIVHVNADIILNDSFVRGIAQAQKLLGDKDFFMSGRRWDLDYTEVLNTDNPNWQKEIVEKGKTQGVLHGYAGMDYWVFPKKYQLDFPPFVVGRPSMDSWLIAKCRFLKIPVIDSTAVIDIVHQNHNYPQKSKPFFKQEKELNLKLAGGPINLMTLREAEYLLTEKGLEKPTGSRAIFANLALFYPWRLLLLLKRKLWILLKKS